jgi:hypothetical protein
VPRGNSIEKNRAMKAFGASAAQCLRDGDDCRKLPLSQGISGTVKV